MVQDQKNRQSYSLHRKFHSTNLEDYDLDHKIYRALLSLFADNLNTCIKSYQDCLFDLEEHPRIRVHQEEVRYVEAGLSQICRKHIGRLSKESFYRNAAIRKGYQQFSQQYQPRAKEFKRLQCENISFRSCRTPTKIQNNFMTRPIVKTDTDHLRLDIQRRRLSYNYGIKTFKSETQRTKSFQNNSYTCKLSEFKVFESNQIANDCSPLDRIKTSYDRKSLQTRIRRGSFTNKDNVDETSNQNSSDMVVQGEEVIVTENRHREQDWEVDQNEGVKAMAKPVKTFCTPRVLAIKNRGQNPQASFAKLELLRKTKNFWVSSVQPQGYRARSRQLTKILAIK